ncbi:conjugal transfer protein [Salmonella enterica subsp. enterica]|nr:conjugal transfer protein [Salmonella enterica subsp. enterica]
MARMTSVTFSGEMEISARMMITGGDPKEEADLKRADRAMIREALLMAAHATYKEGAADAAV